MNKPEHPTPRELEVVELISRGLVKKQVAAEMHLSIETVGTYIKRIYEKFDVHTHAHLVRCIRVASLRTRAAAS